MAKSLVSCFFLTHGVVAFTLYSCCVQFVEQVNIESLLASTDDKGEPSEEFQVQIQYCFVFSKLSFVLS